MFLRVMCCLVVLLLGKVSADEWDAKHLGFSGIPIQGNEKLLKELGFGKLPTKKGLLVAVVNPDTPTAAGGLLPLAVVSSINRKPIGSQADATEVLVDLQIGDDVLIGGHTLRNNVWKNASIKTKVMTYRSVLESSMEKSIDALNGHVKYTHKFFPKGQERIVQLYVRRLAGESPELRAEAIYGADEWLFMRSLIAANGGDRLKFNFPVENSTEKVKGGYIVERNAVPVTVEFGELLVRPGTMVRIEGTKTYYDHDPTISEIWINRDVIAFYRMISAKP